MNFAIVAHTDEGGLKGPAYREFSSARCTQAWKIGRVLVVLDKKTYLYRALFPDELSIVGEDMLLATKIEDGER
jgi:hypothetical protein